MAPFECGKSAARAPAVRCDHQNSKLRRHHFGQVGHHTITTPQLHHRTFVPSIDWGEMSLSSRPGTTQARNTCYRAARSLGSQHVISCLPRTSIHEVGRWACQAILSEISAHSLWLMMVLPHSPGPGTLRHHVRGTSVGCLPKRCINKKVRLAASVSRPQVIHRVRLSHLRVHFDNLKPYHS